MKSGPDKAPPLSPATLHILLALAQEDMHGYGIIQEVTRYSDGHYKMGPGTLYDNLKKLMDAGLVADAPRVRGEDRRFYTLTGDGRNALAVEVERLRRIVRDARLRLQETRRT